MFFELFLVGMTRHDAGRLLETTGPVPDRHIAIEFRSRHTTPIVYVLEGRRTRIEDPGYPADARIFFDAVGLNLLMFHRTTRIGAVLTGKVMIRGPRPWLVLEFLRVLRMP
jgi:hypothetical protein